MTCPNCRHRIRVLEDEEDLHSCPYCGGGRDEEYKNPLASGR